MICMKKIFSLIILGLFVILMVGVVSAETGVLGQVYDADTRIGIENANVLVSCAHNTSSGIIINTRNTTSISNGWYGVEFPEIGGGACDDGDEVIVYATTAEGLYGESEPVIVVDDMIGNLDVAIANVPMVPEFGLFMGILTLFGAIGVFFFVRR